VKPRRESRRLPFIRQVESCECGLACLGMIAAYHGCEIDLAGLRRRAASSRRGTSLAQLGEIAATLGLDSRPLSLKPDELAQLRMPCILHWDGNHFVALAEGDTRHFIIHDPLSGVRELTGADIANHFSRAALELWPRVDLLMARRSRRTSTCMS